MHVIFTEKLFIAIIVIFALAACGDNEKLKNAVRDDLKDPDSAKFYDYEIFNGNRACYVINAKNSMGGYTGKKTAILFKNDGNWQVINFLDFDLATCVEMFTKNSNSDL